MDEEVSKEGEEKMTGGDVKLAEMKW